jgi:hypothetical protein
MATEKQPRKSTRAKKATGVARDTEVPLATGADGHGVGADSANDRDDMQAMETESLDDRIRQRAYELYLARGSIGGSEMEDWLEAERQLRASRGADAAQGLDAPRP